MNKTVALIITGDNYLRARWYPPHSALLLYIPYTALAFLFQNGDLFEMIDDLGIDNNVSTKYIVANRVISYVRALNNTRGSNVRNLYRLVNNQVEALEFAASTPEAIYNKSLKDLRIKKNCLIAAIIRNNDVIIPNGSSDIRLGDSVVVVTTCRNFDDLTDVFE